MEHGSLYRHLTALPERAAALRMPVLLFGSLVLLAQPILAEPTTDATAGSRTAADPAAELARKRDDTRQEIETLSRSISLSQEKVKLLESSISELEKSGESLRTAIVDSAGRRKEFERKILDGEKKLEDLRGREEGVHASLRERRGLLAEVLAALQRMGRNPPPALLVTPEDALSSVRSAILLGAVVPGIRTETNRLAADLKALSEVRKDITAEKTSLSMAMTAGMEEERRIELLLVEQEKLKQQNAGQLAEERRRAEELAGQATGLEGLIGSLENEIRSVREAAEAARAKDEERRRMTEEQRDKAREVARNTLPDKNRIAPAYAFSELQKTLDFPASGAVVRRFGEADGTGHPSQGLMIETNPGALVTAPADGWIVFAGSFRSYGQMIILNAGDGYHIVLSGMDRIDARQGQFVVAGEPLAVMGEKRVASVTALALETDRPTLYIEFRKSGKPVDSQPWWAARDTGKARNDT